MTKSALIVGIALATLAGCSSSKAPVVPAEAPTASAEPTAAPAACAGLEESQCKITEGCGWNADGSGCVEQKKEPLRP